MALKDDILNDLDKLFNTDEFATTFTYNSENYSGIFVEPYEIMFVFDVPIEVTDYTLYAKQADLPSLQKGDTITINSANYEVTTFHEEAGILVISLRKVS